MLRFRFHGRGGQGMKTASRILGTAAFLSGYHAQDTPLYGAERRGAPITAYTRIHTAPIHGRGVIDQPDVIIVADPNLIGDPMVQPLHGLAPGGTLVLNSPSPVPPDSFPAEYRYIHLDATGLAIRSIGLPIFSSILASAACKVSGLIDEETMEKAAREELGYLGQSGSFLASNIEAALHAFEAVPAPGIPARPSGRVSSIAPAPLRYLGGTAGTPTVSRPMNMAERHTGNWRTFRPWIERALCARCNLCFLACPEGCIRLEEKGYPLIDYLYCKGCLICEEVCPRVGAVLKEREENDPWS